MNGRPLTGPSAHEAKALSDRVCDATLPFLLATDPQLGELVEAALKCADALLLATGGDRV